MTPKRRNATRRIHVGKGKDGSHKRGKLWQAIRILRTFTTHELQAVTELENRASAVTFCGQLRRAGFLTVQRGNEGRHQPVRYHLVRDSGPLVPSLCHGGADMYDPNEDKEYPIT